MRSYLVKITDGEAFELVIPSTDEISTHLVTADQFKRAAPIEDLNLLFNGRNDSDCGFILKMGFHGPVFIWNTVFAPVDLDDERIQKNPASHHPPMSIPLGLPAEHRLTIGNLKFRLSVVYTE